MYIEVVHDALGNIMHCYCADTLPAMDGDALFTVQGGLPEGQEQARINIDTLTAMEIDGACGQKAVIDPATGQPKLIYVDRSQYIIQTYRVDLSSEITPPTGVNIPPGMKVHCLAKKV